MEKLKEETMDFRIDVVMQTDDNGYYHFDMVVDNNDKVMHLKTSSNVDRILVYREALNMLDSFIASLTHARNEVISDIKDSLFA